MMLSVKDLSFEYNKGELVLHNLSFSVGKGGILALLGPNGAGKTTLLRSINSILKPRKGVVMVEDADVLKMSTVEIARKIGYVSQNNKAGNMSVFDAILLGRKPHIGIKSNQNDYDIVSDAIHQLGLGHLAMRNINHLSGGELQKVCIARAFVQEPRIFLLDEPTSNLDLKNQMDILKTIRSIVTDHSLAAVMTMHNLDMAFRVADHLLLINKGHVVTYGPPEAITAEILSDVYGVKVELVNHNGHIVVITL